jgi:hypothetical protein
MHGKTPPPDGRNRDRRPCALRRPRRRCGSCTHVRNQRSSGRRRNQGLRPRRGRCARCPRPRCRGRSHHSALWPRPGSMTKWRRSGCASTCAAKEYFNGRFWRQSSHVCATWPPADRTSFFQAGRSLSATSAAGSALARLLRPHLAPATWADDALDLFASVWRYELAAAVALLVALRRILITYV